MFNKLFLIIVIAMIIFTVSCKKDPTSSVNTEPTASFTVNPTSGTTATIFNFDASSSSDNEDATSELQVRWDWENDGSYDTNWSTDKTTTYQYSTAGTYTVKLEVKDSGGLTHTTTKTVTVSNGGGGTGTVTDVDGNVYQTVQIGNQEWMAENLKVTRYRNGEAIPNVTGYSEWQGLINGAYSNFENNDNYVSTYGRLYNWYAVDDSRNIAPAGWHVATDAEWKQLEMYLGMSQTEADDSGWRGTDEGGKLKEAGTTHWNSPNTGATNSSGFTALPGGYRGNGGTFYSMGYSAYFWSSTEGGSNYAWYRTLGYYGSAVGRYSYGDRRYGFSVRCVRD